jgi:hypothetical protein
MNNWEQMGMNGQEGLRTSVAADTRLFASKNFDETLRPMGRKWEKSAEVCENDGLKRRGAKSIDKWARIRATEISPWRS